MSTTEAVWSPLQEKIHRRFAHGTQSSTKSVEEVNVSVPVPKIELVLIKTVTDHTHNILIN